MDVTKAQGGIGLQTLSGTEDRDQAMKNAVNHLQARYGEKPKEARQAKKQLDKDDFMRIMLTEMKHQDPTKPMDADRMATQMAQMTSVEQLKNVSTALDKLADKSSASDRLAMSAMIGKTVTVDKGRFSHLKGTLSPVNYDLPEAAQKIKFSVLDDRGNEIASHDLEAANAGPNSYNWDGLNESGIPVPTGNYIVRIDAENAQGSKISINPISKETVVGISMDGGDANFLIGDPKNPQKVNFRNVTRIEGDSQVHAAAQAGQQNKAQAAQNPKPGVAANQFQLPDDLKKALLEKAGVQGGEEVNAASNIQKSVAANSVEAAAQDAAEPGFPNGLKD